MARKEFNVREAKDVFHGRWKRKVQDNCWQRLALQSVMCHGEGVRDRELAAVELHVRLVVAIEEDVLGRGIARIESPGMRRRP